MARTVANAAVLLALALPASADQLADTRAEIEASLGFMPEFFNHMSAAALPGMWKSAKEFRFNPDTTLDMKTKFLISQGVSAQIPFSYCVWQDTVSARAAGTREEEIA